MCFCAVFMAAKVAEEHSLKFFKNEGLVFLSSLHVILCAAQQAVQHIYPSINQTMCIDIDALLKEQDVVKRGKNRNTYSKNLNKK